MITMREASELSVCLQPVRLYLRFLLFLLSAALLFAVCTRFTYVRCVHMLFLSKNLKF
jgi:hypothetical protein